MLTRYVERVLGPTALENLIECVELLRLRQLRDIACVNKERRWSGHRVNAIERNLERRSNILVRFLAEPDMTIADLQEAEFGL